MEGSPIDFRTRWLAWRRISCRWVVVESSTNPTAANSRRRLHFHHGLSDKPHCGPIPGNLVAERATVLAKTPLDTTMPLVPSKRVRGKGMVGAMVENAFFGCGFAFWRTAFLWGKGVWGTPPSALACLMPSIQVWPSPPRSDLA